MLLLISHYKQVTFVFQDINQSERPRSIKAPLLYQLDIA